ncbi:hypothetical protein [Methylocystis bryophila]|uniref:hypothetical protein n=1 Tax=Methylocystis bryophila TaxID=655015 RepID=UPI00131A213B|nr:hypothetical protein [Methylocystis bryophila]
MSETLQNILFIPLSLAALAGLLWLMAKAEDRRRARMTPEQRQSEEDDWIHQQW